MHFRIIIQNVKLLKNEKPSVYPEAFSYLTLADTEALR